MSTTIGQRWAIHRRTSKHDINHHMEAVVVEFAESERALQRQECAEALWKAYEETSIAETAYGMTIRGRDAILSAGTEPTNPFGCGCEWFKAGWNETMGWKLLHNNVHHTAESCDYCPRCGAKRRNT